MKRWWPVFAAVLVGWVLLGPVGWPGTYYSPDSSRLTEAEQQLRHARLEVSALESLSEDEQAETFADVAATLRLWSDDPGTFWCSFLLPPPAGTSFSGFGVVNRQPVTKQVQQATIFVSLQVASDGPAPPNCETYTDEAATTIDDDVLFGWVMDMNDRVDVQLEAVTVTEREDASATFTVWWRLPETDVDTAVEVPETDGIYIRE